jgi:hypothetical protein
MQNIAYKEIKIGRFESDDLVISALVIYLSEAKRHVTMWHGDYELLSEEMDRIKWEAIRDEKDLVLVDVQTAEFPTN